jgi:hypothetical protein
MNTNEKTKLDSEIELYNKLGLKHTNKKYIKSKEFTNILFEMIKENLKRGVNYDC